MIAYLKGKLTKIVPTYAIVEVMGIGYQVHISLTTFAEIKEKQEVQLAIHDHVREDAHLLFGFASEAEKHLFQQLISVNGVGPSTALIVLSYLPPSELKAAIVREDSVVLQGVKGIGGKTAQRMILELKDKLKREGAEEIIGGIGLQYNTMRQEALGALITLGITKAAAEKSVDAVLKSAVGNLSLEELVKQALKNA